MTTVKVKMFKKEEINFVTKETTSWMASEINTTIAPSELLDDEFANETITKAIPSDDLYKSIMSKTTVPRPRAIFIIVIIALTREFAN